MIQSSGIDFALNSVLFGALAAVIGFLFYRTFMRSARDVAIDLLADYDADATTRNGEGDNESDEKRRKKAIVDTRLSRLLSDDLGRAGIYDPKRRAAVGAYISLLPLLGALITLLIRVLLTSGSFIGNIIWVGIGAGSAYLYSRRYIEGKQREYIRRLEYHLPLVMERIVMGVQAGLDVLPTVRSVVNLQRELGGDPEKKPETKAALDPVTELLSFVLDLTERGLTFDESLGIVSQRVHCSALRHAFTHLALAQREGGEIMFPLRELADATQAYYQETIEEDIAKLPVKATMPLVVTFTGLLIAFATVPMLQVLKMLADNKPKMRAETMALPSQGEKR